MKRNILTKVVNSPDAPQKNPFSSLTITDEALYKAILISKIFQQEIVKKPSEIGGLQLNFRNKYDGVTRDVTLGVAQNVEHSEVVYPHFFKTINEGFDDNKYKVVGIWHSHADFGVSHSGPDNSILKSIYSMSRRSGKENVLKIGTNEVPSTLETRLNGDYLDIFLGVNPIGLRIDAKAMPQEVKEYLMGIRDFKILLPIALNYANSLIINNSCFDYDLEDMDKLVAGKNYSAKTYYQSLPNVSRFNEASGITLNVIHERNGISLDEDEIKEQILKNVLYNGKEFKNKKEIVPKKDSDFDDSLRNKKRRLERVIEEANNNPEGVEMNPVGKVDDKPIPKKPEDIVSEEKITFTSKEPILSVPKEQISLVSEQPIPPVSKEPASLVLEKDPLKNGNGYKNDVIDSNRGDSSIDDFVMPQELKEIERRLNVVGEHLETLSKEYNSLAKEVHEFIDRTDKERLVYNYYKFVRTFYLAHPETQNEKFVNATARIVNKDFKKHYLRDLKYNDDYSEIDFIPEITDWKRIRKAIKYLYKNPPKYRGHHNNELEQIAEAVEVNPEAVEAGVADDIAYTIRKKAKHVHFSERVAHYANKIAKKFKKKTAKSSKNPE